MACGPDFTVHLVLYRESQLLLQLGVAVPGTLQEVALHPSLGELFDIRLSTTELYT